VVWFALVDSRITRREFGHGDLFLTREAAEAALAEAVRDGPDLEPFPQGRGPAASDAVVELTVPNRHTALGAAARSNAEPSRRIRPARRLALWLGGTPRSGARCFVPCSHLHG
jgi:hypothetical protein